MYNGDNHAGLQEDSSWHCTCRGPGTWETAPHGQLGASLATAELICKGSLSTTHSCGKGLLVPAVRRLQPGQTVGVGRIWQGAPRCQANPAQDSPQVASTNKMPCLALPVRAPKAFVPAVTGDLRRPGKQGLSAPFTEEMEIRRWNGFLSLWGGKWHSQS